MKCFVTFTNNRPSLAAHQLPLLTAGLRQHLEVLVERDQQEVEDSLALCNQVQQLAGLAKRKKEDWGNVAPYLVADILSTNLQLNNHNLKQALITATHSFSICARLTATNTCPPTCPRRSTKCLRLSCKITT